LVIAILLLCLAGFLQPDSGATIHPSVVPEGSSAGISAQQLDALSRMRVVVSECLEGTRFCVSWGDPDSAMLARSGVPIVVDESDLEAGSRVEVTVAVMDSNASSQPTVSHWSTVLGSGELPTAIEWILLDVGICGNYEVGSKAKLLQGLPTGGIQEGHGGFRLILAATRLNDALENGPDGRFIKVRSALAVLDASPKAAAALLDSVASQTNIPDALRLFHARALGRAGRCLDQFEETRILFSHGLADSAFVFGCSEGYCLLYSNDFEALADWAFARVVSTPVVGDCVASLWERAIDTVVRNPSRVETTRAQSFMDLQRTRLSGFASDPRFDKHRFLISSWERARAASKTD
jgi:hypothetical protein